jgi:hypothetical protein
MTGMRQWRGTCGVSAQQSQCAGDATEEPVWSELGAGEFPSCVLSKSQRSNGTQLADLPGTRCVGVCDRNVVEISKTCNTVQ